MFPYKAIWSRAIDISVSSEESHVVFELSPQPLSRRQSIETRKSRTRGWNAGAPGALGGASKPRSRPRRSRAGAGRSSASPPTTAASGGATCRACGARASSDAAARRSPRSTRRNSSPRADRVGLEATHTHAHSCVSWSKRGKSRRQKIETSLSLSLSEVSLVLSKGGAPLKCASVCLLLLLGIYSSSPPHFQSGRSRGGALWCASGRPRTWCGGRGSPATRRVIPTLEF